MSAERPFGSLPVVDLNSPMIVFDAATTYGIRAGLVYVALEAIVDGVDAEGKHTTSRAVVGHLRCSIPAAAHLENALHEVARIVADNLPPNGDRSTATPVN